MMEAQNERVTGSRKIYLIVGNRQQIEKVESHCLIGAEQYENGRTQKRNSILWCAEKSSRTLLTSSETNRFVTVRIIEPLCTL